MRCTLSPIKKKKPKRNADDCLPDTRREANCSSASIVVVCVESSSEMGGERGGAAAMAVWQPPNKRTSLGAEHLEAVDLRQKILPTTGGFASSSSSYWHGTQPTRLLLSAVPATKGSRSISLTRSASFLFQLRVAVHSSIQQSTAMVIHRLLIVASLAASIQGKNKLIYSVKNASHHFVD